MEVMKDLNKSIDPGTEKLLVPRREDKEEDKKESLGCDGGGWWL